MNKSIAIIPFPAWEDEVYHLGVDLEIAQRHLADGDSVQILGCHASLPSCDINLEHSFDICLKCQQQRHSALRHLSPQLQFQNLHDYRNEPILLPEWVQKQHDKASLQDLHYDNFDIGYAVASSLIWLYRSPSLGNLDDSSIISNHLKAALHTYFAMQAFLEQEGIDRVYVFNGRFTMQRAILRACQNCGIDCHLHERGHDYGHFSTYENQLPHNIREFEDRLFTVWNSSRDDLKDRRLIARRFFEERRGGIDQNWYSHSAEQTKNLLPASWDTATENLVIFNSSEDEFASIGPEWEPPLYPTQITGLKAIIESLKVRDYPGKVYLRLHPNLKGVSQDQIAKHMQLSTDFVEVIPPESPISSYALLDASDRVLTFGSTMGIEATYWGKPSILAGQCFYRNLDVTYNPTSHEELLQLLLEPDLPPIESDNVFKFGYYQKTFGTPFKYFEPSAISSGTFRGRSLAPPSWAMTLVEMKTFLWRNIPQIRHLLQALARRRKRKAGYTTKDT